MFPHLQAPKVRSLLFHLHWGTSKGPCIFGVLSLNHIENSIIGVANLSLLACSAQTNARVFTFLTVWKSLVPEASVWGMKFLRATAHWVRVGHPTNLRPHVWGKGKPECHCLPLAIVQRPQHWWSTPSWCTLPWRSSHILPCRSSHYLWFLSTSGGVISNPAHLCQDSSAGVVHQIQSPIWPWSGSQSSSGGFGMDLWLGSSSVGGMALGVFARRWPWRNSGAWESRSLLCHPASSVFALN